MTEGVISFVTSRPRLLAIMGSGETAPTMAKVHRLLVDRLGEPSQEHTRAVLLDSPYGFQENADEICQRTVGYFRNLRIPLDVASWRTADDVLARERALARIDDADYLFSGSRLANKGPGRSQTPCGIG